MLSSDKKSDRKFFFLGGGWHTNGFVNAGTFTKVQNTSLSGFVMTQINHNHKSSNRIMLIFFHKFYELWNEKVTFTYESIKLTQDEKWGQFL